MAAGWAWRVGEMAARDWKPSATAAVGGSDAEVYALGGIGIGCRLLQEQRRVGLRAPHGVGPGEQLPRRPVVAGQARDAATGAGRGCGSGGGSKDGRGRLALVHGRLEDLRVGPQDGLELVEPLLELAAVAGTQAGLLPRLVLARGIVTAAPAARRLPAVTFYLRRGRRALVSGWPVGMRTDGRRLPAGGVGGGPDRPQALTFLCLHSSQLPWHC